MSRFPVTTRIIRLALALTVALPLFSAPTPAVAAYPSFSFAGSGWGHGIGLSQYGAKGFAEHGKTGEWIAAYYYPGTSIGSATERGITVLIDPDVKPTTSAYSKATWTLRPGWAGTGLVLNKTATSPGQSLPDDVKGYRFTATGDSINVYNGAGTKVAGPAAQITVSSTGGTAGEPALIQVMEQTGIYSSAYTRYRGKMNLYASGGKIKLINELSMSEYLYGVVPRESPSSWHVEALKAQAIVARSYAQKSRAELFTTTYSQAYAGHSKPSDRGTGSDWEASATNQAVDATKGKFVKYGSEVITTYFFSSSGGHTANKEDVWGGAHVSYYTGVPDPYSEEESPNDPWPSPVVIDGLAMAKKLAPKVTGEPSGTGTSVYVRSLGLDRAYPSDFVRDVDITWSNGARSSITGDAFRSALGMKSTKFYLGGQYTRVSYKTRYDTAVRISQQAYPTAGTAKAVVLVNGADNKFADALTASALGGVAGGPVLMVYGDSVPTIVSAEIKRLGVTKAYVVGGPASVNATVFNQVKALVPNTKRLAGDARYGTNRYGTAASVAMEMKALGADGSKVLIASGEKWTDAAVAAAVAAGAKRPIVLTAGSSLPAGSKTLLSDLGAKETAFFGGPATISAGVTSQICAVTGEKAPTRRFGLVGNRYDVAVQAAQWCTGSFGYTLTTAYVSSGEKFPDTVTGGVVAGLNKHPLLLTAIREPSKATSAYFAANKAAIEKVVVFGGPASVSDKAGSMLASYAY